MTFVTWNPSDKGSGITLSNGNLTSSGQPMVRATDSRSSGKWYWEVTVVASANSAIGVASAAANLLNYTGGDSHGWGYYCNGGVLHGGITGTQAAYAAGAIIGIALDMDALTVQFYKDGTATGALIAGLEATMFPANGSGGGTDIFTANFGATSFAYAPPSGYSAYGAAFVVTSYKPLVSIGGDISEKPAGMTLELALVDVATALTLGTFTSGADVACSGYITFVDSGGITRKLMITT